MSEADRASRLLDAARRDPTSVELDELRACLEADSTRARRDAVEALGRLALAGRAVGGYADLLDRLCEDTDLLAAPVRLSIDPDSEQWFRPRAMAFAVAALAATGAVDRGDAVRSVVRAQERRYREFDQERRTRAAVQEVGWAFASVVIYTDGYVDVLVGLTDHDDDTVRRVGAAALSDVAEKYAPIRGESPAETPRLVAVAAELLASDPDPIVRSHGAFALYEFALDRPDLVGGRSAVLEAALGDDEAFVRREAAATLGIVDATDALSALEELAETDPDERVREAAAGAREALSDDQ